MLRAHTDNNVRPKIHQQKANQDLIYAIYEYDMGAMLQAIEDGADLDTSDTLGTDGKLMPPPLIAAIDVENLSSFRLILNSLPVLL